MKRLIHLFKKKRQKYILDFDEDMFLDANPDIREAIKRGQFHDVKHHLMMFGLDEIRRGLRPFHRAHEVFNEEQYLKRFPEVAVAIKKGEFSTPFDHFCQVGYRNILEEKKDSLQIISTNNKVSDSRFLHSIDTIDKYGIVGWVYDQKEKNGAWLIKIYINGKYFKSLISDQVRTDVLKVHGVEKCGFSCDFGRKVQEEKAFYVEVKIQTEEGEENLTPNPVLVSDPSAMMETFFSIQNFLKKESETQIVNEIVRKAFSDFISDGRNNYRHDGLSASILFSSLTEMDAKSMKVKKDVRVDVIVPIYCDVAVTQACIESLLNAKNKTPFQIFLINDKSPDEDMHKMLHSYMDNQSISLFENDENLGFVKTVNKGMQLSSNDVILLNSDTVVTDYWLDKLYRAAISDKTIATVTPMSNSATILSYPKTLIDNEIPDDFSPNELNSLFGKCHKGKIVDLPTAHGFCMYIKRAALDELGYFNEEKYGKGYGEENDFSLRALTMGWRNVAACDTFVAHIGSVSFSSSREDLIKNNLEVLNKDYPEYSSMVMRFIAKDPLRKIRREVSKEVLKKVHSRYMLFVSHTLGGGTEKAMKDLATLLAKESVAVLVLTWDDGIYTISNYENAFLLEYEEEAWSEMLEDLKALGIFHIHFHHLMTGWQVTQLPKQLHLPYDFTVHDYMPVCPRINLVDESKIYCEEPNNSVCKHCLESNGVYLGLEKMFADAGGCIESWRERFSIFLAGTRCVFVPNQDVAIRLKRYFPDLSLLLRPHPEKVHPLKPVTLQEKGVILNVAIIGAISEIKGYNRLYKLVKDASKRHLPIRFVVIGYTQNDERFDKFENVIITGKYAQDALPELIRSYHCTHALFLSIWPETYSYTLTESLEAGLFPVAYEIGAIADRLKRLDYGKLLPLDTDAERLNDILLLYKDEERKKDIVLGKEYKNMLADYYKITEDKN